MGDMEEGSWNGERSARENCAPSVDVDDGGDTDRGVLPDEDVAGGIDRPNAGDRVW